MRIESSITNTNERDLGALRSVRMLGFILLCNDNKQTKNATSFIAKCKRETRYSPAQDIPPQLEGKGRQFEVSEFNKRVHTTPSLGEYTQPPL